MGTYVKHVPCPSCGSRDNLAIYSDGGGYCWGCGYVAPPKMSPYVTENIQVDHNYNRPILPDDARKEYPDTVISWAVQFGISIPTLIKRGVLFSDKRKYLIFPFYDKDDNLIAYNARNFDPNKSIKYITYGSINKLLPIYYVSSKGDRTSKIVIVEDCISAMKIALSTSDSMPCLGSTLSAEKITRLGAFYDEMAVWLDGNMYRRALEIEEMAKNIGMKAYVINTEKDPKEYKHSEINMRVHSKLLDNPIK